MASQTLRVLDGFFDDAAVFPPGSAPLPQAVADHLAHRRSALDSLTGPLVLPADTVEEAAQLVPEGCRLDVGIVVGLERAAELARRIEGLPALELRTLELKTDTLQGLGSRLQDLAEITPATLYVELTHADVAAGALEALQAPGARAKFRTGGLEASLFPSVPELAEMIRRTVQAGLRFKCTAGLHEAIRYTNASTGFTHHGFVNIADAAAAAAEGAGQEELEEILGSRDAEELLRRFRSAGLDGRAVFGSFGTCSIPEPLESLEKLGAIPASFRSDAEKEEHMVKNSPQDSAAAVHGTSGYGVENLPFGSFRATGQEPRLGVRLGRTVFDAHALGELAGVEGEALELLDAANLDRLLTGNRRTWDAIREKLQAFLGSAGSAEQVSGLAVPLESVELLLPFTVADYVDFYASEHHATNVGKIFRPDQAPLLPNWKHLPIGYHGRSGTVVVSGTDIARPKGLRPEKDGDPTFGPCRRLDIEAEMGFVVGDPVPGGEVALDEAEDHIFGVVLVNDWSARDIQAYEYVPLGPFLGKSFGTSVSVWVTPWSAFDHARVDTPARDKKLAEYLDDSEGPQGLDIEVQVFVDDELVSTTPYSQMYYSPAQMLTHMGVNGASLRAGDFFASGTISGPETNQRGSFLELSWGGEEPLQLADGTSMTFLQDGQTLTLRASARAADGARIELSEVTGTILPAR